MNNEVLIRVENVKKKFCRLLKRSMLYGIQDISRDILGLQNKSNQLRKDEFLNLWEGRFKSSLINTERYFFTVSCYIELNPVRASMVTKPEEYPWIQLSTKCYG